MLARLPRYARAALPALLALVAPLAAGQQVTVITSFPKELTEAYKKAFEAKNPGAKVEILNKGTPAGVAYVRETPAGSRPDVFWASAPDAFEVLAKDGLLQKYDPGVVAFRPRSATIRSTIPQGFYRGQALAGYGIMWNTRYLKANKPPDPKEWADLAKPVYFGHVAISSPSRSGTTHLTIETILQGEGWDKGWSQILQICGQLRGDHRAQLRRAGRRVERPVRHRPRHRLLRPRGEELRASRSSSSIRASRRSCPRTSASSTARRTPTWDGSSSSSRCPRTVSCCSSIRRSAACRCCPRPTRRRPRDTPTRTAAPSRRRSTSIPTSPTTRYYVVSSLFDQTITFRHKELVAATEAIDAAAAKLAAKPSPRGRELLAEARAAAFTPLVDEQKTKDKGFVAMFRQTKRDAEATKRMTALEEQWGSAAKKNYARAVELANEAARLAK